MAKRRRVTFLLPDDMKKFQSENAALKNELDGITQECRNLIIANNNFKFRWEKLKNEFWLAEYENVYCLQCKRGTQIHNIDGYCISCVISKLESDSSDGGFHYCDYCKKTFPTLEEHEKHHQLKHKPKPEKRVMV